MRPWLPGIETTCLIETVWEKRNELAHQLHPAMRTRSTMIFLAMACLAGSIIWSVYKGTATPPPITTRFLGYTNGSTVRLGMFAVSNSSARAYLVVGYYGIQVWEPKGRGAWIRGTNAAGASLPAGDYRLVTVPASAQSPWRASITCRLDYSADMAGSTMFLVQLDEMGVPTRYRSFEVRSDWITQ